MSELIKTRYLILCSIKAAEGSQTFYADAESEEEALAMHENGESDIYSQECEVQDLGEPEIFGTTELSDFGDFSTASVQPQTDEEQAIPDTSQQWEKLDGATAFHLIERHADDWSETGRMMESWANAWQGRAALSHPIAAQGEQDAINRTGTLLANFAFNFAQKFGHTLTGDDCSMLDKLRKDWDAAIQQAKPAGEKS